MQGKHKDFWSGTHKHVNFNLSELMLFCKCVVVVDHGEENYPAAPAGIRTRDLSVTSPAL